MNKNIRKLLVLVAILALIGLSLFVYKLLSQEDQVENSPDNIDNDVSEQPEGDTYEVVFQSGEVLSAEGNKLPEDVNLEAVMPELPPTSHLIHVFDNNRPGIRRIVMQYDVKREMKEFRELMISELNEMAWDSIEQRDDGSIFAKRDKTTVLIEIKEAGKRQLSVFFDVRIYK
ncbi:hypothetical protein GF362_07000 [Candidatus Dojkabacteria bacterium]|nr:hypothetical protein [Candidatus Dojkabacteria bacterium]